jgi:hypothetical protein
MKVKAEVVIELDGREVYRGHSKSFVQNFAIAYMAFLTNTIQNVTQIDGTTASIRPSLSAALVNFSYGLSFAAEDDDDTNGIWVGSGSTPVSPTDYNLASKITHGTGSGQLDYDPQTVTASYGSSTSYVEIIRSFVNRSGADVIVREVGIVAYHSTSTQYGVASQARILIARDVLPDPILVPNLASLTVKYIISLSL